MILEKDRYEEELENARRIAIAYPVRRNHEISQMIYLGSEVTKSGTVKDYYKDPHTDRYYYEPDFAKRWRINERNKRLKK